MASADKGPVLDLVSAAGLSGAVCCSCPGMGEGDEAGEQSPAPSELS